MPHCPKCDRFIAPAKSGEDHHKLHKKSDKLWERARKGEIIIAHDPDRGIGRIQKQGDKLVATFQDGRKVEYSDQFFKVFLVEQNEATYIAARKQYLDRNVAHLMEKLAELDKSYDELGLESPVQWSPK